MPRMTPDPTFYPTAKMAMEAPPEGLAYVALMNPELEGEPDALAVVDVDPDSSSYGEMVGRTAMPEPGDELHHFGWNACSSCLCPTAPHPHMERRYLVVPGLRSSRIHVLDVNPDGIDGWMVKVDASEDGSMTLDERFLLEGFGALRPHQVRLEGGDASSDSYCFS